MDSDLDPNAFLQSVRELKEKRQKEDNERYEQLEQQIKNSRLARQLGASRDGWIGRGQAADGPGAEREREMGASPPASPSLSPQRTSAGGALPARATTLTRQPRSRPMSVDLSPTRASSVRPMSMVSIPEQGAPLPTRDSQRFAPPANEPTTIGRTMSNAQSRLDRPPSPTKGMGGFVQSAMLKRTDSVNKRWSAHAGPSTLDRHNSTASVRSTGDQLPTTSRPDSSDSRPTSSHSTISNLNIAPESQTKELPKVTRHSRSRSLASFSTHEPIPEGAMSPPLSPSKRWSRSPTKASWLESALARPESPKPAASPQTTQPSWMADITRAKLQRNSTTENVLSLDNHDASKPQDTPPVFGQGLLKRSSLRDAGSNSPTLRNVTPPTKAKPVSLVGKPTLPEPAKDQPEVAAPTLDPTPVEPETKEPEKSEPEETEAEKAEPVKEDKASEPKEPTPEKPKPLRTKPAALSSAPFLPPKPQSSDTNKFPALSSPRSPALKSPEPKQDVTPKTDFRSGLKSRSGTIGASTRDEPEFKAMFGKLKKAHTEKFVAPDELKNNILRGKAGLSLSAGPQKSERRDELRDSLIKKKEEMKAAASEKPAEPKVAQKSSPVPEALNIRKQLGRSNSTLNVPPPEKGRRDITPEALSFHKNLRGKPKASVPEKRSSATEKVEPKRASTDEKPAAVMPEEEPVEKVVLGQKEEKPEPVKQEQPVIQKKELPMIQKKELPIMQKKELPTIQKKELPTIQKKEMPIVQKQEEPQQEVQEQPKPLASNKFADRFNPALAGLLARGPPSASNPSTPRSGSPFSPSASTRHAQSAQDQEPGEGKELTHMTKSRARGPKRRKPNANAAATPAKATPEKRVSSIQSVKNEEASPGSPAVKAPVQPRPKSAVVRAASINLSRSSATEPEKPKTPTPTKVSLATPSSVGSDRSKTPTSVRSSIEAPATGGSEKSKPPTPAKTFGTPSSTISDKPKTPTPSKVSLASPPAASPLSAKSISNVVSPLSSVRKPSNSVRPLPAKPLPSINTAAENVEKPLPPVNAAEADKENQSFSVKGAASMWGKQAQQTPPPKRNLPVELPTKKDEEAAMVSAGLLSSSPLRYKASPPKLGLGISEDTINPPKRVNSSERTPTSAGAPPKPAKSSRVVSGQLSAKDLPRIPDLQQLPAGKDLLDFFSEVPRSSNELQLNTQNVLSSRSGESDKMKTLRSSIQEIKADGSLLRLPAQQEHILYENSMYICTHIFGAANGAKMAEVYLWCGDSITESTIQETQVHAKRVAREAGIGQKSTQLYIIDQAREPAGFFQALGGIVITRRGSRADSVTRPYMLCGRPHMGHIAFDEVDRSKTSLCSEYPYIVARPITLQETKVWMWKGSGCGPAAIGSARLIGMDLNPGGEIIEVEEGKETQEFLRMLGDQGQEICKSPALWSRANAAWEHSAVRLFRIEAVAPKQTATSLFTSFLSSRRPSWSAPRSPDRPGSASSNKSSSPTGGKEFEASISEIAPFTQDDLEPEGCYVLDAGSAVLVLPGPLLAKSALWNHAFTQAMLFAHDYAILSASLEDRPAIPKAAVVFNGLPREAKMKFRRWEDKRGLWGVGAMMAGKQKAERGELVDVREALEVCCGY